MSPRLELLERWERIERELRVAVSTLKRAMPSEADDWAQVAEFIDHNEFGVAFDWIVDTLAETGMPESARPAFVYLERVYNEWGRTDHEESWHVVALRYGTT
jgi:hypothetical protein